jgi:hypothetical protein
VWKTSLKGYSWSTLFVSGRLFLVWVTNTTSDECKQQGNQFLNIWKRRLTEASAFSYLSLRVIPAETCDYDHKFLYPPCPWIQHFKNVQCFFSWFSNKYITNRCFY